MQKLSSTLHYRNNANRLISGLKPLRRMKPAGPMAVPDLTVEQLEKKEATRKAKLRCGRAGTGLDSSVHTAFVWRL